MNGNVYPGASFSAGSFGGMVIHPEEKAGTDSLEGCYERCASTTGLVRRVKKSMALWIMAKNICGKGQTGDQRAD